MTYYYSQDDLLPLNDHLVTNGRTYMYCDKKVLYPFGFGLSYTSFKYSSIRVDKPEINKEDQVSVEVDITNSGNHDGDEVVQLYLKDMESSESRPIRQLKGFERIHLKKGETKTVQFTLDRESLSFWNIKNDFVLEPGVFEVQIGASSEDIRQKIQFDVLTN